MLHSHLSIHLSIYPSSHPHTPIYLPISSTPNPNTPSEPIDDCSIDRGASDVIIIRHLIAVLSSCAPLGPPSLLSNPTPSLLSMARILRNISYVTNATQQQQLDLYLPTNATNKTPLIVYLHGGAWLHRDKADYAYFAGFWAIEHGLACAVLNYTLSPERPSSVIHPVHVNDCADAIAWYRNAAASVPALLHH